MDGLAIGEVVRQAGANPQTILYYERRGLLLAPPRSPSNYRRWPADTIRRVRFIRRAQGLGFTLREISELPSFREAPARPCSDVAQRAEVKMRDIDQRVRSLTRLRQVLTELVKACVHGGNATHCPILEALDVEETS